MLLYMRLDFSVFVSIITYIKLLLKRKCDTKMGLLGRGYVCTYIWLFNPVLATPIMCIYMFFVLIFLLSFFYSGRLRVIMSFYCMFVQDTQTFLLFSPTLSLNLNVC